MGDLAECWPGVLQSLLNEWVTSCDEVEQREAEEGERDLSEARGS